MHQGFMMRRIGMFIRAVVRKVMDRTGAKARRQATKIIKSVESAGGLCLPCGCLISVKANDLRRIMELTTATELIDMVAEVEEAHQHATRNKVKSAHANV